MRLPQTGQLERAREVGFDGDDPRFANGRKVAERANRIRIGVDGVDGAAGAEELGQRERERAGPGAEVGPDAGAVSDRVTEQIDRFLNLHLTPR